MIVSSSSVSDCQREKPPSCPCCVLSGKQEGCCVSFAFHTFLGETQWGPELMNEPCVLWIFLPLSLVSHMQVNGISLVWDLTCWYICSSARVLISWSNIFKCSEMMFRFKGAFPNAAKGICKATLRPQWDANNIRYSPTKQESILLASDLTIFSGKSKMWACDSNRGIALFFSISFCLLQALDFFGILAHLLV